MAIRARIQKRQSISAEAKLQYGSVLSLAQSWTISSVVHSILAYFSTSWRTYYLNSLFDSFYKQAYIPFSAKDLSEEIHLREVTKAVNEALEKGVIRQPEPHQQPVNLVEPLIAKAGTAPIAYHKQSHHHHIAPAIMERFVWDLAVLMDVSEQFAPTRTVRLINKTHPGSLQPALTGGTLAEWIDSGGTVPLNKILQGMVTLLVFGLFDAHTENVFYTDDKRLIFFDNTRAFCNSNSVICYQSTLMPAVRCGFFELDECYQELTPQDIEEIKEHVAHYEARIPLLKTYFQSQKQLKKLPAGWVDTAKALSALQQRIARLKNMGTPHTLRDLCFIVHSEFRFLAALSLTQENNPQIDSWVVSLWKNARENFDQRLLYYNSLQTKLLQNVGHNLPSLFASNRRIDPALLYQWCNSPLSFEEILDRMVVAIDLISDRAKNTAGGIKIYHELLAKAEVDAKDFY